MSHAESQAKRLLTLAASAKSPTQRKRFERLARKWADRALETASQRDARLEKEMRALVETNAEREARRAEARILEAERQARRLARPAREPRQVVPLKRGRLKRKHTIVSSALQLLLTRKAARRLKRLGLPPLPY